MRNASDKLKNYDICGTEEISPSPANHSTPPPIRPETTLGKRNIAIDRANKISYAMSREWGAFTIDIARGEGVGNLFRMDK